MKKICTIFLLITTLSSYGFEGEYRFYIKDSTSSNYYIYAIRYDLDEPIFGAIEKQIILIEGNEYNSVLSDKIRLSDTSIPPGYHYYLGYDLQRDAGSVAWPLIADGKYEFQIYREDILILKFKMDLRHSVGSPDIDFKYTYPNNFIIAEDELTINIYNDQELGSWSLYNTGGKDWSLYSNEIELKNSINHPDSYVKLEAAEWDFPETSYSLGTEFVTGSRVTFWLGANYEFSIKNTEVTQSGKIYKFRNWFGTTNFDTKDTVKITSNQTKHETNFYQTLPLTVTNNLEGGSSGTYTLTWSITDSTTDPISSGNSYNVFEYNLTNLDRYSINVNTTIPSVYGQNWAFLEWSDGVTSTTRSDEQIRIGNKDFTAYYKSWNRTDNANTYSSNGQNRMVQTSDGTIHKVYESLGKVWYEKSTNNGVDWTIMNNGAPISAGTVSSSTIAVRGLNEIIIGFVEENNIRLKFFDNWNSYNSAIHSYQISDYANSFSLGWDAGGHIMLVYGTSFCLKYWFGYASGNGISNFTSGTIPNTGAQSYSPSIVAENYSSSLLFHLVWQEAASIKYYTITGTVYPTNVSFTNLYDVSSNYNHYN